MLGMWGGGVQAREWVRRMLGMLAREVLDGDGRDVGGDVRGLSDAYVLWGGERDACQLHMQQGLYGGGRYGMYGMRGGQLQGGERIGAVLVVSGGNILGGGGSNQRDDMWGVPQSHALGARQHGDRRLRVQYGVHGT